MVKDTAKAAPPKGQTSINTFFGGGKTPQKSLATKKSASKPQEDSDYEHEEVTDDDAHAMETEISDEAEDEEEEEELPQPKKSKPRTNAKKAIKKVAGNGTGDDADGEEESHGWQANLPPIHNISEIFSDIVSREPGFKDFAERVCGRKLRVATMCSGTESPLLALEMMRHFVDEQYGVPLEIEHVFSCEIEPFKQAYIERNFQPPLLFRDVCELGQSHATTAYGALAPVPGNVDLLVAGTSCVDYSNLNNEKQGLEAKGESGETFRGMMRWVTNHSPPIVILENVKGAPWAAVCKKFEEVGYSAQSCYLDTKKYYIPHTRQRGYLIAVHQKHSKVAEKWKSRVADMARPASSSLDSFLLPTDDPRIHQAREKLAKESYNAADRRTGRTDWAKCQQRHERERVGGQLGLRRPLTHWEDGGSCKVYDYAWQDWAVGQVERVWDLMDISILKAAKEGLDPSYKTQVWNLSQNVDRNIAAKLGLCPCLTPSMIPYITNRGGPMIGIEALSLQGLPVDRLLLTRETEDNLADLAGNAMSTTVVGTCIMVALVLGRNLIRTGDDTGTYEQKDSTRTAIVEVDIDGMDLDQAAVASVDLDDRISGENDLITRPLDHQLSTTVTLTDILRDAERSSRLCECEGRTGVTDRQLNRCKGCGSSSCVKCGGRPEHDMEALTFSENSRLSPLDFVNSFKSSLPTCISIDGVDSDYLEEIKLSSQGDIPAARWTKWRDAVLRATQHELPFVELKRQEIWTVIYESTAARAELTLHPLQPEWRLYAKPEVSEKAFADIRNWLEKPVARVSCDGGLLTGTVHFALPLTLEAKVQVEGTGRLVPAWESRLGLQGEEYKDKQVHSALRISVDGSSELFERDIEGTYELLENCGTANSALHKRQAKPGEESMPPLFLIFDPTRTGPPAKDSFVISISRRRYEFGESRPIITTLDKAWRPSSSDVEVVECAMPCQWIKAAKVSFKPSVRIGATYSAPGDKLSVDISEDACKSAIAILKCDVPLPKHMQTIWPHDKWNEVDKSHERETFRQLAWLFESIPVIGSHFNTWQDVPTSSVNPLCQCDRCAPSAPSLQWAASKNNKIVAVENTVEAGEYERRLKNRPSPFITQLKLVDDTGTMRIGINFPSLLHRALSRLPTQGRSSIPRLSWRLDTQYLPKVAPSSLKFRLISNREDPEHQQPPDFTNADSEKRPIRLRHEQLRSLHWMLERESASAAPFTEEEVSEAVLDALGWRVEARAQREVQVRGGVLADQVGYGKTAITLGVIDCTLKDIRREFASRTTMPGKIPTKATLIVVPPHLTKQWPKEVKKFISKSAKLDVVTLSTQTDLNKTTVKEIVEADIVFVASNLYQSTVYLENLVAVAGGGDLPNSEGRYFNARLESILESLGEQVDRLRDDDEGPKAVMKEIKAGRIRWEERQTGQSAGSKRLKGKMYRDSHKPHEEDAISNAAKPVKASPNSKVPSNGKSTSKIMAPSRRIVEVVLPRIFALSDGESAPEDSSHEKISRPRRKTASSRKIVESDEENEGDDDNYDGSSPPPTEVDDTTSLDEDMSVDEESDDVKPVKKRKIAAPRKTKKATTRSKLASSEDDEVITVNDSSDESAADGKKRKASADGGKAAKRRKVADKDKKPKKEVKPKKRREATDPWGFNDGRREWDDMKCPPLEMFHFARKVVDEYTYLSGRALSMVKKISADRHWVLSGTPPTHNFAAVKFIAQFLNLHLGVDDDGDGAKESQEMKKRRNEQTAVERFHSFREVHTPDWHNSRHAVGQKFLDHFVRQNIAEIDEIPSSEHIKPVTLPAAERAIYLELEHHLRALDMTIKRSKKSESDREKRLQESMGDSATAEEALLKRCAHFDLNHKQENAMSACEVIVEEREHQLEDCKKELLGVLKKAVALERGLDKVTAEESRFPEYVQSSKNAGVGDLDAKDLVLDLFVKAGIALDQRAITGGSKAKVKGGDKQTGSSEDRKWELREQTHSLRRLTKELAGRVRSLRYFTVVRDLQKRSQEPRTYSCRGCGSKSVPLEDLAVLSSCGHVGCQSCVYAAADREECVEAGEGGCQAPGRRLYVVKGDTLGKDDERINKKTKHFGKKLEDMIRLIKDDIPKDERILIFVQFPDLMQKVNQVLLAHKLSFLEIKGTAHTKSGNLQKFQDGEERILLLNVMDESASGANLTGANHAIFISPLLTASQEIYEACETQAIGRLRRFGQEKHVYVYRFLTTNTIDEQIYQERVLSRQGTVG